MADILAAGADRYLLKSGATGVVWRACWAIQACRTSRLGGHAIKCRNGHVEGVCYNACRNRNCPRCAFYRLRVWLERQARILLGCAHHHIIFTIPHDLNVLWRLNYRELATLLFHSARDALFELAGDPKLLGALPGAIMALHTWGQQLPNHPHLHCVTTAGGADSQGRWVSSPRKSFLPAEPLKQLFRGKFIYGLRGLAFIGRLRLPDGWGQADVLKLCRELKTKRWNVNIRERYQNPKAVLEYLGRYINGGPMGESRLLAFDGEWVSFRYKDYRDQDPDGPREKPLRLELDEFIRRYLQHVPPKGFHMVRGYGLYCRGGSNEQLRQRLRDAVPITAELLEALTPRQPCLRDEPPPDDDSEGMHFCSVCGSPLDVVWCPPRAGPLGLAA